MARNGTFKIEAGVNGATVETYAAKSDIPTGQGDCHSNVLKVINNSGLTGYIALTTNASAVGATGIRITMGGTAYYLLQILTRHVVRVTDSEVEIPSGATRIEVIGGFIRGGGGMGGSGGDGGDGGEGYPIDADNYYGGGGGGSGGSGYAGSDGAYNDYRGTTSYRFLKIVYGIGASSGFAATSTKFRGAHSSGGTYNDIATAAGGSNGADGNNGADGGGASPSSGGYGGSGGSGHDQNTGGVGGENSFGGGGYGPSGEPGGVNGGSGGWAGSGGDGGDFSSGSSGDAGGAGADGGYGTGYLDVEYWL